MYMGLGDLLDFGVKDESKIILRFPAWAVSL